MPKEYKLTSIRLQELEQELQYLKTIREKEVAEQIKEARSFGDLSENSEYDEAKNEQAKTGEQGAPSPQVFIIDDYEDAAGRISLGCTVKIRDVELDETEIYAIVGSQEADPMEHRISDDSPFGRAMLGKTVGDIVEVEAPVGTLQFEILSVEK